MRKMKTMAAVLMALLLSSCTTCNCDLAKKLNQQSQRLLVQVQKQKEEISRLREEIMKERLRAEAAEQSARISARKAEDAMRTTRALFIRLQTVQTAPPVQR